MKMRYLLCVMCTMLLTSISMRADETITVSSTGSDISENLDLKAVATLFGEVNDLEKFEEELNSEKRHINNLDLNGDGIVDYLRVVEVKDGNKHLVVIQAILAKDIYQDVATIYVEKAKDNKVTVQIVGDEYIYGVNYVIEPVYFYRPVIYDWFWGAHWVCWHSPYYWGYYPHYWGHYHCWYAHDYWMHMHYYHHHHAHCSYRYAHAPRHSVGVMRKHVSRNDYAVAHPNRSFAARNASRNIQNARPLQQKRDVDLRSVQATGTHRTAQAGNDANVRQRADLKTSTNATTASRLTTTNGTNVASARTFGSSNVRRTNNATLSDANVSRQQVTNTTSNATRVTSGKTTGTAKATTVTTSRPQSTTTTAKRSDATRVVDNSQRTNYRSSTSVNTSNRTSQYGSSSSTSRSSSGSSTRVSSGMSRPSSTFGGGSRSTGTSVGGSRTSTATRR